MTQNKTELALQNLKKRHQAIQNQIVGLEQDHLFTYLPSDIKDSILEAYIALNDTLENEIQKLEDVVGFIKINQGLGL